MYRWLILVVLLAAGCGSAAPEAIELSDTLTVEQWKTLPIELKYDEATFERLRAQDPTLQTDRGWDRFMKEVIVPERRKDIPGVPGQL